jgi:flagellar motor switch protein FliM
MLTAGLLSQDEIKALLGNPDDDADTSGHTDTNNGCLTHIDLTEINAIQTRFMHFFRKDLYNLTRSTAELSASTSSYSNQFADFINTAPTLPSIDCSLYSPVTEPIQLTLDHHLVSTIVDHFFGGSGEYTVSSDKLLLSAGETHIAQLIFAKVTASLEKAWPPLSDFAFQLYLAEAGLPADKAIRPDEPVVISTIDIQLPHTQGKLQIILPHVLLVSSGYFST